MHSILKRARGALVRPDIPRHLSSRFRTVSPDRAREIEAALLEHHFSRRPDGFLTTQDGRKAVHDQMVGRLDVDREWFITWLAAVRPLDGLRVLEIGCGTGSSTVALAEQGARVTAVDIDEPSLEVSRARMRAYGLSADFVRANGAAVVDHFAPGTFDLILFFASVEHMVHRERLLAMQSTWDSLAAGSIWCITDTPNRLWYYDVHTSRLNFFHWLPNDLALEYSRHSPRDLIRNSKFEDTEEGMAAFLRMGRGVSYHEFELAMGPLRELDVVSSMRLHFRRQKPLRALRRRLTLGGRYEAFLARVVPDVPRAFLLPKLDLILQKH
jgi:S-adenosylmethionine-dependent methyltransferase